jgi:hypothetical protein
MNRMVRGSLVAGLLVLLSARHAPAQQSRGFVIQGGVQPESRQQNPRLLTNNSIVKLVKAGLGDDTIVAMVTSQPGRYSLGADDVIALKRAGVPEKVIAAMAEKSAGESAPTPILPPAVPSPSKADWAIVTTGDQPLTIPNEPGLYAVTSPGSLNHIVGRVTSFERSGSLLPSMVTYGIHAARVNTQIPGSHAQVTVGRNPVFYYRTPGSQDVGGLDLVLTHLTVKGDRRQFETGARGLWRGSNGVSVRHQVNYDAIEVGPGLYQVTPTQELESGQYAFYMLRGREHASTAAGQGFIFDFQVE